MREGAVYSLTSRPREVYMRVSIAVCEVPEQTEKSSAELFSHVLAYASGPREGLRLAD